MTLGIPRSSIVVAIAASCSLPPATAQQLPPLPAAVVEALPRDVREPLLSADNTARAHPDDASAVGRLGMLLHAYEQYALADACYARARALDPDARVWAYLAGIVEAELGNTTEAIAAFRRTLAIDPGDLPARLRLADALLGGGNPSGSRAEYEALIRRYPELAIAHYGLGRVLAAIGDSDGALQQYQQAVKLAPQFGQAHYALALAYRDAGAADKAADHMNTYGRFRGTRPAVPDSAIEEVRALVGTSRELIAHAAASAKRGRTEEAIALHLQALEADPAAAQAHVNLISLYARAGQADKAEQHYQQAVRLGSHLADAHYNFGVLLATTGRPADAAAAFRRVLEIDPFHASAHNNLAALLAREGKREEALDEYRYALASDPMHQAARLGLGRVLAMLGRSTEAIEHFEKLLRDARGNRQSDLAITVERELQRLRSAGR
jgi:tetratricopeptide (TPR) repeat protein